MNDLIDEHFSHSGFSKGYKEAFQSGEQEPWLFRGGLTGELQVRILLIYYK